MVMLIIMLIMAFNVNIMATEDEPCGIICVWDGGDNGQGAFIGSGDDITIRL